MERKYKAFISYRHLPIDIDTAVRLHRIIERFVIPKRLRKNGEKRLGLVFRDQDELPISNSLDDNIRMALDNSEFLIVICTPETSKSQWVLREISYFLEHHDRDHVLTVLADGSSETAFPRILTELRDENGDVLRNVEPLAANILADSAPKRRALLKKESLRLIAALIGCAYDELYRRQHRRRQRLAAAAGALVGLVASAFIGMLLLKNAQITELLRETQIGQSEVLASLSETERKAGNFRGALEYALEALPSEGNERPYIPQAEAALVSALRPYDHSDFKFLQSYEQSSEIRSLDISDSGSFIALTDYYGQLSLVDANSGRLLWQQNTGVTESNVEVQIFESRNTVLASLFNATLAYSLDEGKLLWRLDSELSAVSDDGSLGLFFESDEAPELIVASLEDGSIMQRLAVEYEGFKYSLVNEYAGALSKAFSCGAMLLDNTSGAPILVIWDFGKGETVYNALSLPGYDSFWAMELSFTDNGDLLFGSDDVIDGSCILSFARSGNWQQQLNISIASDTGSALVKGAYFYTGGVALLRELSGKVYFCNLKTAYAFDAVSGAELWHCYLPDLCIKAGLYDNGSIGLVMADGSASICNNGMLGLDFGLYSFDTGFGLVKADFAGESFDASSFVLVSEDNPFRASIAGINERPENSVLLDYESIRELGGMGDLYMSQSGFMAALIRYDYETGQLKYRLFDPYRKQLINSGAMDCESVYSFTASYLTADGKYISNGKVVDLASNTVSSLVIPGSAKEKYNYWEYINECAPDGTVLTAAVQEAADGQLQFALWEDGVFDTQLSLPDFGVGESTAGRGAKVLKLGANGYAIIAAQKDYKSDYEHYILNIQDGDWQPVELEQETDSSTLALAQTEKLAAFVRDGELYIQNLSDGSILGCDCAGVSPRAVSQLMFSYYDALLFAFFSTGDLAVIDTNSGELVSLHNYRSYGIEFKDHCRYSIIRSLANDKMLIIYDGGYSTDVCLALDRLSMERAGEFFAVSGYVPAGNELIMLPENDAMYMLPLLSLEQLMSLAAERLG